MKRNRERPSAKSHLLCWGVFLWAHLVSAMLFTADADEVNVTLNLQMVMTLLIYTCAVVPVLEELIFRGLSFFILSKLEPIWQIGWSAFFFAIAHQPPRMLPTFCLGLLLGREYSQHHNLRNCVLLHAATNLVDGLLLSLFPTETLGFLFAASALCYFNNHSGGKQYESLFHLPTPGQ